MSTTWPIPLVCLESSDKTIPKAACRPAILSPILKLGRIGASPGTPFTYRNPLIPSHTDANPGLCE